MEIDLTNLDDSGAIPVLTQLLDQLSKARREVERSERLAAGIRKMIDGLVEMFPATEDVLPEDLDDDEEPRPRGAEAVRRVLAENLGEWYPVPLIVVMLQRHNWTPNSSKPANAVRTALGRLVENGAIEKSHAADGSVIYRHPKPALKNYDYGEEPF